MVRAVSLWKRFQALPRPRPGAQAVRGIRVEERRGDYLASTTSGAPVLLVSCRQGSRPRSPIRLKNLSVDFQLRCKVVDDDGGKTTADFARIECIGSDAALYEAFIAAGEAILRTLPDSPTDAQVGDGIDALVDMFTVLTRPSSRSLKGLWAELLLMSLVKAPDALVRAWHTDPQNRFDFSFPKFHLEVKASEIADRVHEFSVEQIRPSSQGAVLVVSTLLQRTGSGVGVLELVQAVATKLRDRTLVAKLWTNMASALGKDFNESVDIRFDREHARTTLRVVDAKHVPCIATPFPVGVLAARVRVSMDHCAKSFGRPWQTIDKLLAHA